MTIPAGPFTLVHGQYQYLGTINGIKFSASISGPVAGVYTFTFAAIGPNVVGVKNKVTVTLQLGANFGSYTLQATIF